MKSSSRLALFSWAMYDWANSSFSAIIQTFIFAAYFTESVALNSTSGSVIWGVINSVAALIIAITGPVFGSIADYTGRRKYWLGFFSLVCILATMLMWFVIPGRVNLGMILAVTGIVGAEISYIFYDAMLPGLAGPEKIGKWSGWGWGLGYAGGVLSLLFALILFIQPIIPWISLEEGIRATFLLCGVWYFIFSLPLFLFSPDLSKQQGTTLASIKLGFAKLKETFSQRKKYRSIFRFLIARMLIIDGLTTLFSFGGVYAATVFGMSQPEVLLFGIFNHVFAGIGAFSFASVDDRIGSKKVMLLSLFFMIILGFSVLFVSSSFYFWIIGISMSVFVGPVQAAARSWMAKNAPQDMRNQMFGLVALSGKATAFFGPFLTSLMIYSFDSLRLGMIIVPIFFLLGSWVLFTVKECD